MATYDPKDLIVTLTLTDNSGLTLLSFGKNDLIEVDRSEDTNKLKVGTSGEACWIRSQDRTGIITIPVLQGSEDCALLSALVVRDEKKVNPRLKSIRIECLSDGTNYTSDSCKISRPAKGKYSSDMEERTFNIICKELYLYEGSFDNG